MEKKNSLFAGLSPAPAPSFAPSPGPAPRPAVSDQEVSALKQKIEAMEKNIVSQLEKKIGEAFKASGPSAPPPPPPGAPRPPEMSAQFLLTRIGELDRRLEEFTRSAMVSSAQMKNIEESKISARREIEDLLKVVREQQKYSELDRQMHDQLEKSWRRVEELEKKLMDFYGSILSGQQKKEDIDGMLSRELGGRIDALAARLELHTQAVEKKLLAQDTELAASTGLKKEVMTELVRTREETLALGREQSAAFKGMFEELLKGRLELIQNSVASEMGLFKKEFAGQMTDMRGMLEEFKRSARENRVRAEGVEEAIAKNTADTAALLQGNFEKISETLGREGEKFLAELDQRNKRHFDALNTKYADALSNASVLDVVYASADASVKKLTALEGTLADFLKQVDKGQLSAILGVSGMLIRKNFDALEILLAGIKDESAAFDKVKQDIKDRIKDVFGQGQV